MRQPSHLSRFWGSLWGSLSRVSEKMSAVSCLFLLAWAYTFNVVCTSECPKRSCTSLIFAPDCNNIVQCMCLSLCGVRCGKFAFSVISCIHLLGRCSPTGKIRVSIAHAFHASSASIVPASSATSRTDDLFLVSPTTGWLS